MLPSFRLGTLFGFPIRINLSFLLMLAIVTLSAGGVVGLPILLVAFVSILLHELGHALVARRLGVPIREIEFHFFGGAAKMVGLPRSAGDEIRIAAAGPAVSLVLAGAGAFLGAITGTRFFAFVGFVNLVIGLFNLLPALPMDGGRILRAAFAKRMGFLPATRLALRIARWFALAMAVYGIVHGPATFVLLAVVLWLMGFAELAAAHVRGYGGQPTARAFPWQTLWMPTVYGPAQGFDPRRGFAAVQDDRDPAPEADPPAGKGEDVEYIPPPVRRPPSGRGPTSYRVYTVRF